ncbi:MAG: Gldg family protein [Crocinitomicaceae bacterium]|nr:Gldg family protein [Crocinitomicaceae bacterium]
MAKKLNALKKIKFYHWIILSIVLVFIVLINIISSYKYVRIDMTTDQRYSISEGTKEFLKDSSNFKNRMSIKIYLDGKLPADLKLFQNTLKDKLLDFKEIVGDRIEYIFIDPNEGEDKDNQALKETIYANGKGVLPLDIHFTEKGANKQLTVWPGAIINYGGENVNVIQLLPGTTPENPINESDLNNVVVQGINNLEYELISSMKRAMQKKKPRIAFLHGHGELKKIETYYARALLKSDYNISDVEIKDSIAALDNFDGLIIARPKRAYSDKDLYVIDQFLLNGGKLMCFLDGLNMSEDTLRKRGNTYTTRHNPKLNNMLFDYGITLNADRYVWDKKCNLMIFPQLKNPKQSWHYKVLAKSAKHPIYSDFLPPVLLNYSNEVKFTNKKKNKFFPILTSSPNSRTTNMTPIISFQEIKIFKKEKFGNKKICLAGIVEGEFTSHFKDRLSPEFANNPESKFITKSNKKGKLLLIGNGRWVANDYDSLYNNKSGKYEYQTKNPFQGYSPLEYDFDLLPYMHRRQLPVSKIGNQTFLENLVNYMMGDHSLIQIRSKNIEFRPINRKKVEQKGQTLKLLNLLIPVLSILIFGFVIDYFRKIKYAKKEKN